MPVAFIADRRLCLTADRLRIVEQHDPESAFLFVSPGHPVSDEDAKRFGLTCEDDVIVLPVPSAEGEDARADRKRDLKAMKADEVKDIAAGLDIAYTNKDEAIEAILAAEFSA